MSRRVAGEIGWNQERLEQGDHELESAMTTLYSIKPVHGSNPRDATSNPSNPRDAQD